MIVYVVESGEYSDRYVSSIHSSLELAKAYYPDETWEDYSYNDGGDGDRWNSTTVFGDVMCITARVVDPNRER